LPGCFHARNKESGSLLIKLQEPTTQEPRQAAWTSGNEGKIEIDRRKHSSKSGSLTGSKNRMGKQDWLKDFGLHT
jgi:hypothetical protein